MLSFKLILDNLAPILAMHQFWLIQVDLFHLRIRKKFSNLFSILSPFIVTRSNNKRSGVLLQVLSKIAERIQDWSCCYIVYWCVSFGTSGQEGVTGRGFYTVPYNPHSLLISMLA